MVPSSLPERRPAADATGAPAQMTLRDRLERVTVVQVRAATGLVLGIYVVLHLANHSLGLISLSAQELARPWIMAFWQSWLGLGLLYGSLYVHAVLGLRSVTQRRHFRLPKGEWAQLLTGLFVPYLLLVHILSTRGTRLTTGIDIDYEYEIANLWVDPWVRMRQVALVLLVWGHFVAGLHFWLRFRPWYRKRYHWLMAAYLFVPAMGLLGFAEAGKTLNVRAAAEPGWLAEIKKRGVPSSPTLARRRALLREWLGPGWLAIVAVVFAGTIVRNRRQRKRRYKVTYPENRDVSAPVGMTVLEVSRMVRRPHMAVCGGRGRCTTCRIRVHQFTGHLPAPQRIEAEALARLGAPDGLRLACQLRPHRDLSVEPLVDATQSPAHTTAEQLSFGEELRVTVLFLDVRGSTKIAETRLPFDVVFLMSHFFAEMAAAVEEAGGHYSNFTGDGLMALFGLENGAADGARAALRCALDMLERLERINRRMASELETPLGIGIGIHTGEAIVGRMGPPKTPVLTALGDTVNTTARLEGMTKELGAPVIASVETLVAAGLQVRVPVEAVQLRGRSSLLEAALLDLDSLALCLLSEPSASA